MPLTPEEIKAARAQYGIGQTTKPTGTSINTTADHGSRMERLRALSTSSLQHQEEPDVKPEANAGKSILGVGKSIGDAATDFTRGTLKGVGSTIAGLGSLGEKALNTASEKLFPNLGIQSEDETAGQKLQEGVFSPKNTAEKVGKTVEQIGEFFVPVGQAGKLGVAEKAAGLAKNIPKVGKALEVGAKAALEGGEQALRTAAQEGDVNAQVGVAGAFGAGSQVAGKILEKGLSKLGDAFYSLAVPSTILERGKDLRKQIDVGNAISNTGVSLTRNALTKKIGNKISSLGKELDKAIETATKSGVGTNFDEIANSAMKQIEKTNLAKEIQASPIDMEDARSVIQDTLGKYKELYSGRELDANALQQLKRDIGSGLIKVFDRGMTAPIKAKAITETNLYHQLDLFLDSKVPGYKKLNQKLAPLLEGKERLMKKGAYSGLLTDVVAGSVIGGTGANLLTDPVGFLKGAVTGILLKRGVQSTAAKTMAGTISKEVGKAMSDPKFYQWFRQLLKMGERTNDED